MTLTKAKGSHFDWHLDIGTALAAIFPHNSPSEFVLNVAEIICHVRMTLLME
jgi:hypothetical protein